ncbi:hypothetical protein F4860DRAFT_527838 [Xylaria cubensis]|nr:hypothetical protein F4860DRAFT_527838 [Xylaria cubensis]
MADHSRTIEWVASLPSSGIFESPESTPKRGQAPVNIVYIDNEATQTYSARKRKANENEPMAEDDGRGMPPAKKAKIDWNSSAYLDNLDMPVRIGDWDDEVPPADNDPYKIRDLCESITKAELLCGILPKEIRSELMTELKLNESYDRLFRKDPLPEEIIRSRPRFDAKTYALYENTELGRIQRAAIYLKSNNAHECGWSSGVNEPLLRHVFDNEKMTVINVSTATMEGDSVPGGLMNDEEVEDSVPGGLMNDEEVEDAPAAMFEPAVSLFSVSSDASTSTTSQAATHQTKIVDLVLVLKLPESSNLQKKITKLIYRVDKICRHHVNQTSYECVQKSVIALSVKARREFSGVDPLIQLGVWTAAWHKRMTFLRGCVLNAHTPNLDKGEQDKLLIPVPFITTVGPRWSLYFAFFESDSIRLRGPIITTVTTNIVNMYVLVAWLRAVKRWIEEIFMRALHNWFIVPEEDDGREGANL